MDLRILSTVAHEGWMVRFGWCKIGLPFIHMRYFLLENGVLSYYKFKPLRNNSDDLPINSLQIDSNCRVEDRGQKTHQGKMVYALCVYNQMEKENQIMMAAFSIEEVLEWKKKIEMVIDQHRVVVYEGWMVRYGTNMIGRSFLHTRYIVLGTQLLSYYKRRTGSALPVNSVQVDSDCRVEDRGLKLIHRHMIYVLRIYNKRNKHKSIMMAAFNIQEALIWKEKIEMVIDQHQGIVPADNNRAFSIKDDYHASCSDNKSWHMELSILERIFDGREEPCNLKLPLLELITKNFSYEYRIGHGGCGEVYKGILRNGTVAVKRLFKNHTLEDKMFHQEVKSMMMVKHQNIVRFLGYCSDTQGHAIDLLGNIVMAEVRERLLCFEYISNGSLENHLTDELRGLEWHRRYQIIKGICDGLNHLHKEKCILHMDLKPANILIDDHMVPKISDFGLSRFEEKSQTLSMQRLVSRAYCAPEYLYQGKISNKSDIYSLGVIIIEIVTGSKEEPNITKVLRRWRHRWNQELKHTLLWYQQVTKCLELALRCVQKDPIGRPFIWDIIRELNELDSNGGQITDSTDSTFEQLSCCMKGMLGVEPLEIHFPFSHDKQTSCSIKLTNDTDDYIAFMISTTSLLPYITQPKKDIVPPRSQCCVTITLQEQERTQLHNHCREEFYVQSIRIDEGLATTDITEDMFNEELGKVVDDVNLTVVFDKPLLLEEL